VGHFCIRLLFCLFAEDIGLLERQMFTRLLESGEKHPALLNEMLQKLFGAMATGGLLGIDPIPWFNGGLFDSADTLPLEPEDLRLLRRVAALDWSAIETSLFGTLFERGLDPGKRSQLGAHFTDRGSILRLVDPVVLEPLREEWGDHKRTIEALMAKAAAARSPAARTKTTREAHAVLHGYLDRLARFRVLDPACGSGNFLVLALLGLKDLEHQVILEAEALGLPRSFPMVGPENVLGIEINPFAAELARVTVWIGEIQWTLSHGFGLSKDPILKPLNTIACRDAVMNADGSEPEWPVADVIVGNPPFLGNKKMVGALGEFYSDRLRRLYQGRVPGDADLVTYWFEKARAQVEHGQVRLAGLVATNSIRGGPNRKVLARIAHSGAIVEAWSDEPWINEGAAVRVSLIAFGHTDHGRPVRLDGAPVSSIFPDLSGASRLGSAADISVAKRLPENAHVAFMGTTKVGSFEVDAATARDWLLRPNPHCKPNRDVVKPWANGISITGRWPDKWIVDFGVEMTENEAALYEAPFRLVYDVVRPERLTNRRELYRRFWWRFGEPRPGMRAKLQRLRRYLVTPEVAKHRLFAWLDALVSPDHKLQVVTRQDDCTFGVLQSRIHGAWAVAVGSWHGVGNDPRYTISTCFETFPFPEGLTPADTAGATETLNSGVVLPPVAPEHRTTALAIAEAAHRLNALRENWLNPPEWVDRVPEVVPGYPDRIIPRAEHAAELKKRTLTNLYNARPAWLDHAHQALDAAVAAAYGWGDYNPDTPDTEILRRLLALNLERSADGAGAEARASGCAMAEEKSAGSGE
jgi:type II restriction/modification system DNA methylase subunit YeeA